MLRSTLAVVEMDFRKLRHDPLELLTRAIQPVLWLVIFGQVFARTRAIPSGNLPYLDFMAPGILAQSVLFIAIFYGIAVIWERDLGLVHKLLATPAPRAALVAGKGLAAGGRALSEVEGDAGTQRKEGGARESPSAIWEGLFYESGSLPRIAAISSSAETVLRM